MTIYQAGKPRPKYSREKLLDLYVNQKLGAWTIARMLGYASTKSVYLLLSHYNIPTRTLSQSATLREQRKKAGT